MSYETWPKCGHEKSAENTRWNRDRNGSLYGACAECRRQQARATYRRKVQRIRIEQSRTHCIRCSAKLSRYNYDDICAPCYEGEARGVAS